LISQRGACRRKNLESPTVELIRDKAIRMINETLHESKSLLHRIVHDYGVINPLAYHHFGGNVVSKRIVDASFLLSENGSKRALSHRSLRDGLAKPGSGRKWNTRRALPTSSASVLTFGRRDL
jgi:hypothetical protein